MCAVLYEAYNTDGVKKSSLSEWHNIFEECRGKVMDIERSSLLESHKSSENPKNLRNVFVDTEFDYPKGGVRVQFTCIKGQTKFKETFANKSILENPVTRVLAEETSQDL